MRHVQGYTNGKELELDETWQFNFMKLGSLVCLLMSQTLVSSLAFMRSMPRLHNGQQVDYKCKHMTLGIGIRMFNNNFLLLLLKRQTIISSTPMCYTKYHTVNSYALQYFAYVEK